MIGTFGAEWVKLRSIRSTYVLLGVAVAAVLPAALLAGQGAHREDIAQVLSSPVQLSLAVLGVLAISDEYATGSIRGSLVAVPRRWTLMAAKTFVLAAVTFAAGEAVVFAIFVAAGDPAVGLPLSLGLATMVAAVVGLGLGTVVRSTAGGIGLVLALLFVLPALAQLVPEPWGDRLGAVLLPNLAGQLAGTRPGVGLVSAVLGGPGGGGGAVLAPPVALAAMAAYASAALLAGGLAISRRDA